MIVAPRHTDPIPLVSQGIKTELGEALFKAGIILDPREYASVLHVVQITEADLIGSDVECDHTGATSKRAGWRKQDGPPKLGFVWGWVHADAYWQMGVQVSISAGHSAKAMAKIAEAVTIAGISLSPTEDDAIDVGAAPGSWSSWLAPRVRRVIAIDPGKLDPGVTDLVNVVYGEYAHFKSHTRFVPFCPESKNNCSRLIASIICSGQKGRGFRSDCGRARTEIATNTPGLRH